MNIQFQLGDHGHAVEAIQRKLASLTPSIPSLQYLLPDIAYGDYDDPTANAIMAFKKKHHLVPLDTVCDEACWYKLNEEAGSTFPEVWQFEFDALRNGFPPAQVRPTDPPALAKTVHAAKMAGLAFSGGGIRSATFNLGILQAFAELRLLRDFDYLSTVSGGGYIGAWFSKWLKRLHGSIDALEDGLSPDTNSSTPKREPKEIQFLRDYAQPLTPRSGPFSPDLWSVISSYVINTILTMSTLVSLLLTLLIVPRVVGNYQAVRLMQSYAEIIAWSAASWAVFRIAAGISTLPDRKRFSRWHQSRASVIILILLPLLLAAWAGSIVLWDARGSISASWQTMISAPRFGNFALVWLYVPGTLFFVTWSTGWAWAQFKNNNATRRTAPALMATWTHELKQGVVQLLCAIFAFGVATLLMMYVTSALDASVRRSSASPFVWMHVVVLGTPVLFVVAALAMFFANGLRANEASEDIREWWGRQSASIILMLGAFVSLFWISLYAPGLVHFFRTHFQGWVSAAIVGLWLVSLPLKLVASVSAANSNGKAPPILALVATLAPIVFAAGTLIILASVLHGLTAGNLERGAFPSTVTLENITHLYFYQIQSAELSSPLLIFAAMAMITLALTRTIDINRFSMHTMYRNRLVRAYLGAISANREEHPGTGFDRRDDLFLDELLSTDQKTQRPLHLINTSINLQDGEQLGWQQRKAGSFTLSPAFCGFEFPSMNADADSQIGKETKRGSFRRTKAYRNLQPKSGSEQTGVMLGTAVAISGAAVSPSMGYHSSGPLSFLMTVFNARLGWWFANPRWWRSGTAASPKLGIRYLLSEMFGITNANSPFVYLSDGGHFENLGIYELVRRRCHLVVVVDAGADPLNRFDDLSNAIHKCKSDLGIEIDIDVGSLHLDAAGLSREYCVAGAIHYATADQHAPTGTLLYIKPALRGDEPMAIHNYRRNHLEFPHESTSNQWFNENQFECYRALGYRVGLMALGEAVVKAGMTEESGHDVGRLSEAIRTLWQK